MNLLVDSAIRMSVVVALALAVAWLLRGRSAALRHWILAVAIVCGAAMPLLTVMAPGWRLPFIAWGTAAPPAPLRLTSDPLPAPARAAAAVVPASSRGVTSRLLARPDILAAAVWLTGTFVALVMLGTGLARLARVARRAVVIDDGPCARLAADAALAHGVRRPVVLLQSAHPALVVTWGLINPKILLPATAPDWSAERLHVVLSHELAHVRRCDWALQMIAALLRCVYWFNPLSWIVCRRLRHESEHACDDAVLSAGVSGADYATHLLGVAREAVRLRHTWAPAAAIAHPSTLEGRIRAMLNNRLDREPITPAMRLTTTLGLLALALAVAGAAASARQAPAPSTTSGTSAVSEDELKTYVRETQESLRVLAEETGGLPASPAARPPAGAGPVEAAQAGFASVAGVLADELGGFLPGATVTIADAQERVRESVKTNSQGYFLIASVPSGRYMLEAVLPGFRIHREELTLGAGDNVQRVLELEIGSLEETITVTTGRDTENGGRAQRASPPSGAPRVRTSESLAGRRGAAPAGGRGAAVFAGGIGGQIQQPVKLVSVNPVYPPARAANRDSGLVLLHARIGEDGLVEEVRPVEGVASVPHPDFVAAAIEAVRQWEFTATLLNGVPVEVDMAVTVAFEVR